jgi:hypothetical protein
LFTSLLCNSVPLSVTSLQLQLYVDLCGPQTVTLGLVMN